MSTHHSPPYRKCRSDGWTPERQLGFLDALACSRNVADAAASAGMSREGAYRLRERREGALFGLLWDRVVEPAAGEGHNPPLTNGRIMRLLGSHFRRKRGDFVNIGTRKAERRDT
jgi:hypothetical protein